MLVGRERVCCPVVKHGLIERISHGTGMSSRGDVSAPNPHCSLPSARASATAKLRSHVPHSLIKRDIATCYSIDFVIRHDMPSHRKTPHLLVSLWRFSNMPNKTRLHAEERGLRSRAGFLLPARRSSSSSSLRLSCQSSNCAGAHAAMLLKYQP